MHKPCTHAYTHAYAQIRYTAKCSWTYALQNSARMFKDHRQRIPRFVIRRYLEKSIQKKLFCHLQSLQIKTIFQKKKTITNSISENLQSRFIYGRDVIGANCVEQRRSENAKMKCFYYYNYYYYNRTQHSKPLRYNIRCIRNFN